MKKTPISLVLTWCFCILWITPFILILVDNKFYTNEFFIENAYCYTSERHRTIGPNVKRSHIIINLGREPSAAAYIYKETCEELAPYLEQGNHVIETGKKSFSGDRITTMGLTINGHVIQSLEEERKDGIALFVTMGLGVSLGTFIASTFGWYTGRWNAKKTNKR